MLREMPCAAASIASAASITVWTWSRVLSAAVIATLRAFMEPETSVANFTTFTSRPSGSKTGL